MVVRAGREFLAIPGPTTIPDEVLRAMHRPATDIYSPAMVGMTMKLQADISQLFGSSGQTYIYIANGHGAWEAAIRAGQEPRNHGCRLPAGKQLAGRG